MTEIENAPLSANNEARDMRATNPEIVATEARRCNSPEVTILAHAKVPSPESDTEFELESVVRAPLDEALTREWPTDAHLTQYEPVEIPVIECEGTTPVRLAGGCLAEGIVPRMVALIGDVDPPEHKFTPQWWADVEPKLNESGLAWYRTRNGARVVATLAEPFEIQSTADADAWTARYKSWVAQVQRDHGIALDERCSDWTRIFRLPRVKRDGKVERADVVGTVSPIALPEADVAPPSAVRPKAASDVSDASIERAIAIAERVPPSVEGHGGDAALFHAACELQSVLGESVEAIEAILTDVFNPRCLPPWPASKLKLEAKRAAERAADPVERYARERRERDAQPRPGLEGTDETLPRGTPAAVGDYASFEIAGATPPAPLQYVIRGLDLAPGKVSVVQAFANVAKTPFALLLAICVATGHDFLGMPVKRSKVLFLAFEGQHLARIRAWRIFAGLGLRYEDFADWFQFADARACLSETFIDELERHRQSFDFGAVVLDTYSSAIESDVDQNSAQFATWLQNLGKWSDEAGVFVLCLMHENKSDKADGLRGISGHNAAAGKIQAAIRLVRRSTDRNVIDVECTREVRHAFEPFSIRFSDEPTELLPPEFNTDDPKDGQALVVVRDDASARLAGRGGNLTGVNGQRQRESEHKTRSAGERIVRALKGVEGFYDFAELKRAGAEGLRPAERAIARLIEAGLVRRNARQYTLTDKGREASDVEVGQALGRVGKFDLEK